MQVGSGTVIERRVSEPRVPAAQNVAVANSSDDLNTSSISDYRLFALANIEKVEVQEVSFRRRKDFTLQKFAERSFGVFQEDPLDVTWRFSPQAAPDGAGVLACPAEWSPGRSNVTV
ncbi:WYL domain-containing protein [Bradyrhizobium sp. CCBAU 11386]|uniref:WYL domain-containing protein n=1 Tax=Bradyrhizobium sp. CCBAU 11386 TaxID=1630837 RepID=UPI0023041EBB|nr:WYL domain-containing protein [Bradyrhizobium sp. CCBAU 11386]